MKKRIVLAFFALIATAIFSAAAMAGTHEIRTSSTGGRKLIDPDTGCVFGSFVKFRAITSWTEPTPGYAAQAHLRGVAGVESEEEQCGTHTYEFTLNASTTTSASTINGYWDVYRDGILMCSACTGQAINLNQTAGGGNYYDIFVDDPVYGPAAWDYSAFINARDDF